MIGADGGLRLPASVTAGPISYVIRGWSATIVLPSVIFVVLLVHNVKSDFKKDVQATVIRVLLIVTIVTPSAFFQYLIANAWQYMSSCEHLITAHLCILCL